MKFIPRILIVVLVFTLVGCQALPETSSPAPADDKQTTLPGELTKTNITFLVELPAELGPDQQLSIEFLDEITGLAISPVRVPMEKIDGTHYRLTQDVTERAIIKYRFYRDGGSNPSVEYNSLGQAVRYRFIFAYHQPEVRDQIAAWSDEPERNPTGMVEGKILDAASSEPAGGLLIACGGDQVLSNADGSFRIEKLRPGAHTLSAMSLDGSYIPFQQLTVVAVNSRTPANFSMQPAPMTDVKFLFHVPQSLENNTIRIIGDLSQAGDTFANQGGEQSVLAGLAPAMAVQGGGLYQAVLKLPAGQVFTYKYSLGDGFWNSEREINGALSTRKIMISQENQVVTDEVKTLQPADGSDIVFLLTTPENTPTGDTISIQFNAFDWSPPLPMERIGEHAFRFILSGPQDLLGEIGYRYCRNGRCGEAGFASSENAEVLEGRIHAQTGRQIMNDRIAVWPDWQPPTEHTVVLSTTPAARPTGFTAGFEIQPGLSPLQSTFARNGWNAIAQSGANMLFISPTWEVLTTDPLITRPIAGRDLSTAEIGSTIEQARKQNLSAVIFPRLVQAPQSVIAAPAPDTGGVNLSQWAEMLPRFYGHFARIAEQNAAQYLIVDGSYLNWRDEASVVELLINLRQQFHKQILLAAPNADLASYPPELLKQFDGYYLLLGCPLFVDAEDMNTYGVKTANLLDKTIWPLIGASGKPVLVGLNFAAVDSAGAQCRQISSEWKETGTGYPTLKDAPANLQTQTELYNAVLSSVVTRAWITGVISRGLAMDSASTDASSSVHGKPAADVLWYWFEQMGN
jgi:hypothetical protein